MDMAKKTLIFVENRADAISFVNGYRKLEELSGAIPYAFDKEAEAVLLKNGVAYKIPEQVISFRDYETIDQPAMRFAREWYRAGGIEEALTFHGISLPSLIQRDMTFFISIILDAIILSRKVIQHEKPDKVYCFKRCFEKAARATKAGADETYYGYFAKHFANEIIELESPMSQEAEKNYFGNLFIDYDKKDYRPEKKNILWVKDFEYLDVADSLKAFFDSGYNIKYLTKNNGARRYKVDSAARDTKFDYSCLKHFFQYEGIDFFELMRHKFDCLRREIFPFYMGFCDTLRELFREENIQVVIVAEDAIPFNKTVVSVAKSSGLPTVVLQKGILNHDISFVPVTSDKIAVWGDSARDYLLSRNVEEDKIVMTGSIRFQNYKKADGSRREETLKELGITAAYDKLFLMTLQHGNRHTFVRNLHVSFNEELKTIKALIRAMKRFPNDLLYIKFHPQDELGMGIFEYINEEMGGNIKAVHHYPVNKLLSIADVLVTCSSTTALEALLLDIPVVAVNVLKRRFCIDYAKEGVAIGAESEDGLVDALRAAKEKGTLACDRIDNFMRYNFFCNNDYAGQNLRRLVDCIFLERPAGKVS